MRIKPESINRIYAAADIAEVIGDFLPLKKAGVNFKTLSPFSNERTPSFIVSPSKQIFKCFSSGKGGDAVTFLREYEGLTYVEALKYLAEKYNIEIETTGEEEEQDYEKAKSERDSLFIVLNYAAGYFERQLHESREGKNIALSYFKERGLNQQTIKDFNLGYAPDQWDGLLSDARKNQYDLDLLEKAGLIKSNDKGNTYDVYRGRIIFPIHNVAGKIIGFGGRILEKNKEVAKYINSPETEVYNKSQVLYGLYQAKNEIRKADNCYLVEGYMDVLSLYQENVKNAVASSGTALTEEQIKLLGRYTKNITLLYDSDEAGINAALRGTDLLLEKGMNVKLVLLPEGEDPDSFVQANGGEAFTAYAQDNAYDFISFKARLALEKAGNDPVKKSQYIHDLVNSIARVPDGIQRSLYFKQCSELLAVDEGMLIAEYNKIVLQNRKKQKQQSQAESRQEREAVEQEKDYTPVDHAENMAAFNKQEALNMQIREIIRVLLEFSEVTDQHDQPLCDFILEYIREISIPEPIHQRIIDILRKELTKGHTPDLSFFMTLEDDEIEKELVHIMASSDRYSVSKNWEKFGIYVPQKDANPLNTASRTIQRLQLRYLEKLIQENQQEGEQIAAGNAEKEDEYLKIHQVLKDKQKEIARALGTVIT